jgi:chromosome segregation ATPase
MDSYYCYDHDYLYNDRCPECETKRLRKRIAELEAEDSHRREYVNSLRDAVDTYDARIAKLEATLVKIKLGVRECELEADRALRRGKNDGI